MSAAPVLTPEQIDCFHRDGFVFVPRFYGAQDMVRIAAWTDEVAAWPEQPGRHMVYHEDSLRAPDTRVVQRIEDVTPFHSGFQGLFTEGRMRRAF